MTPAGPEGKRGAGSYLAPAAVAARARTAPRPRRTGRCGNSGCRQRGALPQSLRVWGPSRETGKQGPPPFPAEECATASGRKRRLRALKARSRLASGGGARWGSQLGGKGREEARDQALRGPGVAVGCWERRARRLSQLEARCGDAGGGRKPGGGKRGAGSYLAPAAAAVRARTAPRPRHTGHCGSSGCRQRGAVPQSLRLWGPSPGGPVSRDQLRSRLASAQQLPSGSCGCVPLRPAADWARGAGPDGVGLGGRGRAEAWAQALRSGRSLFSRGGARRGGAKRIGGGAFENPRPLRVLSLEFVGHRIKEGDAPRFFRDCGGDRD